MRLFLILPFLFVTSAYAADPPKMVDIPDPRDGGIYHVPADRPDVIAAIKARIAAKPMPATKAEAACPTCVGGSCAALDEVNATRARRGLPAFILDPLLNKAAEACAACRAANLCQGHTSNDFAFVPQGGHASAAGCAAWHGNEWGSCCTYDRYTYAGAAWSMGRDGRRYMSLFVR